MADCPLTREAPGVPLCVRSCSADVAAICLARCSEPCLLGVLGLPGMTLFADAGSLLSAPRGTCTPATLATSCRHDHPQLLNLSALLGFTLIKDEQLHIYPYSSI